MSDSYLQRIERVTGYRRHVGRASHLAGNPDVVLGSRALADYVRGVSEPPQIEWGIGTAAGLVAGGLVGAKKGHWLLGALSGASIFTNAPALLRPNLRREAFWNMFQTHGGIAASLAMKNNKFLGFILGYLAVGLAREFYGENR